MNREWPTARFQMEHQPLRPGYAERYPIGFERLFRNNHLVCRLTLAKVAFIAERSTTITNGSGFEPQGQV